MDFDAGQLSNVIHLDHSDLKFQLGSHHNMQLYTDT